MKSTWRNLDHSEWSIFHWTYEILHIHPTDLDKQVPIYHKQNKVPYMPEWYLHRWILSHATIALVIHHAYCSYTGQNFTPFIAIIFYTVAFQINAIHELYVLKRLGHIVGFLGGDQHDRNGVPDEGVVKVLRSLLSASIFRPIFIVLLSYRTSQLPLSINWVRLPLIIGVYGIILDFWFYWYHRLMHEITGLWKYHRTHHLAKYPNPLLTLYADSIQELFDISGIPIITYFSLRLIGLPIDFYEWWMCFQYVTYAEIAGHSGLRLVSMPPNTLNWILVLFNAEMIIEDHDLHHRMGWRKSSNYGKQTRLWDRVFGTCGERIECSKDNIDYNHPVPMPWY